MIGAWLWRLGGLPAAVLFARAGFELATAGLGSAALWLLMGAGVLLLLRSLADHA